MKGCKTLTTQVREARRKRVADVPEGWLLQE